MKKFSSTTRAIFAAAAFCVFSADRNKMHNANDAYGVLVNDFRTTPRDSLTAGYFATVQTREIPGVFGQILFLDVPKPLDPNPIATIGVCHMTRHGRTCMRLKQYPVEPYPNVLQNSLVSSAVRPVPASYQAPDGGRKLER